MPKEPDYYTVIEEEDGTLSCNCPGSRQTGKTCEHTFGVKLEIDFGNVERYNDLETIRKTRGKAARGQKNNPAKKKPGRQPQRRSDRTVTADLDRFLDQVKNKINPWSLTATLMAPTAPQARKPMAMRMPLVSTIH
ncbi:hypothetical protein B0H10DRAFT_1823265 [Mycena sp. CBHHK59/15]|nr:hypothetical protein B0H10DRAFT_1823265 [Mycena sp. CBHHK59/15]